MQFSMGEMMYEWVPWEYLLPKNGEKRNMDNTDQAVKKPLSDAPLGIRPKEVIIKERIKEILDAMIRYQSSRKKIPDEWFAELNCLIFDE